MLARQRLTYLQMSDFATRLGATDKSARLWQINCKGDPLVNASI